MTYLNIYFILCAISFCLAPISVLIWNRMTWDKKQSERMSGSRNYIKFTYGAWVLLSILAVVVPVALFFQLIEILILCIAKIVMAGNSVLAKIERKIEGDE